MKKSRIITLLLAVFMFINMIPAAAAPKANTSENEPVLLGTEAEFQTTFDTMFDENGLRKVQVGFNSNSGILNGKYGLINKYGNFVAQPIYDEIKLNAYWDEYGDLGVSILPKIFIGGYTQAVRDGKMGLLNTRGEEVVPCQYDYVGLPSEGMCRVLNRKDSETWYLGYWNLEQNKEVVKPNKYITREQQTMIGLIARRSKKTPAGNYIAVNDFVEGYALVFTEKSTPFTESYKATIIDKNGKDILGKTYYISYYGQSYETYVQKGPYLSFHEPVTYKDHKFTKLRDSGWIQIETFDTYLTGLAGPSGVLIKPSYTTGIYATPGEASFLINPADFQINLDTKTILTMKNLYPDKLYGHGYGVIDFNGKVLIPFEGGELYYNQKEKVYSGSEDRVYTTKYKKLDFDNSSLLFFNGYISAVKYGAFNTKEQYTPTTHYFVKPDGSTLNITQKFNWSDKMGAYTTYDTLYSDFSTGGYVFIVNKEGNKWGLINFKGDTILPFQFDKVYLNYWRNEINGFAVVEQNGKSGLVNSDGKLIVPCNYDSIYPPVKLAIGAPVVAAEKDGKVGLIEIKSGKFLLPVAYESIGALNGYDQISYTGFDMGVYCVKMNGKNCLVDKNGNVVYSTESTIYEAVNGLYRSPGAGYYDNRGRVIFPSALEYNLNLEYIDSFTIYIKGGKVYRASANYLNSTYGYKTYAPEKATALPSSTKLIVNGKNVAVDAYNIGGNNYIKIRDLAAMVNGADKNFEVTWDASKNAINLVSDKSYTSIGGELAKGDGKNKNATRTNSKIYVDGGEVSMTGYNIGGANYFKLRDVMQIFNIGVGWDGATSTATINTASIYALTDYEQNKYNAHKKAYEEASGAPFQQPQIFKEAFIQFQTTPTKSLYKVGEPFEIAGFKVVYVDVYGNGTDISNQIELKVNSTKIYDGYKFTQAGEKKVDCYYKGELLNNFKLSVVSDEDESLLASGDYYMQLMGKYVYPVYASRTYYLELSDKKPDKPFTVELKKVDKDRGPMYHIMYDGTYIMQPTTQNGAQLQSSNVKHQWRINKYSSFCTIRDYGNQKLIVNASGEKSDNGTKIIVWGQSGSAPDHAKIKFIKAD